MPLLAWLMALFLGLMALIFVLYPLYQHAASPQPTPEPASAQAEREQMARAALQEVELDFQLGNLAEADYHSLRERYLRRAYLAYKSRQEREQEIDALIEERLRHMREQEHAKNQDSMEIQDDHADG